MFKKVKIQRFKNLEDIKLSLDQINVIVGANNSGKSSIIQAIQFGVGMAQTSGLELNARWRQNRLPTSISPVQFVYSPLRDIEALAPGGNLRENIESAIFLHFEEDQTEETVEIKVRKGRNKNIHFALTGENLGRTMQSIEQPYTIFVPGLAGIPAVEEYKTRGYVRKAAARGDSNNVFRNILWLLKHDQQSWDDFIVDLHSVFPDIDVDVCFDPEIDETIKATVTVSGQVLPIDASGTGVLQAIQIISYVNVYKPKVLMLDEPDSHLHPDNQRKLAKVLKTLAEKRNLQIILTTHSRHMLDELIDTTKVHWIQDGTVVEDVDTISVLLDLGALDKGDLLRNGGIKCVLLTEDQNPDAIKVLLESSGFQMDEVDIWPYNGCTNRSTALTLAAFIRRHAPATAILIHRDRDYLKEEEALQESEVFETAGMLYFITHGTDAESHFISAEHLNELYPAVELQELERIINESTEETAEKSIEKFINSRKDIEIRRTGAGNLNLGALALEATREYNQNVVRFRLGKIVLRKVKEKLQHELGQNINPFVPSSYIISPELVDMANTIWPEDPIII